MVISVANDGNLSQELKAELAGPAPGHELDVNGKGLDVNGKERQGPGLMLGFPSTQGGWGARGAVTDVCFLSPTNETLFAVTMARLGEFSPRPGSQGQLFPAVLLCMSIRHSDSGSIAVPCIPLELAVFAPAADSAGPVTHCIITRPALLPGQKPTDRRVQRMSAKRFISPFPPDATSK